MSFFLLHLPVLFVWMGRLGLLPGGTFGKIQSPRKVPSQSGFFKQVVVALLRLEHQIVGLLDMIYHFLQLPKVTLLQPTKQFLLLLCQQIAVGATIVKLESCNSPSFVALIAGGDKSQ